MKFVALLRVFFDTLAKSDLAFDEDCVRTYLHDAGEWCVVPFAEAVIASAQKARRTYIMAEDLHAGLVAAKTRESKAEPMTALQPVESGDAVKEPRPPIFPTWGARRPEKYSVN